MFHASATIGLKYPKAFILIPQFVIWLLSALRACLLGLLPNDCCAKLPASSVTLPDRLSKRLIGFETKFMMYQKQKSPILAHYIVTSLWHLVRSDLKVQERTKLQGYPEPGVYFLWGGVRMWPGVSCVDSDVNLFWEIGLGLTLWRCCFCLFISLWLLSHVLGVTSTKDTEVVMLSWYELHMTGAWIWKHRIQTFYLTV